MKDIILKILSYVAVILLLFPIVSSLLFLSLCKNYLYAIIISASILYLSLGFTGVSCFLAIALCIVLGQIGSFLHKKGLEFIDTSMEEKLAGLSDEEKTQTKRGFKIDNILGRMRGL